MEQRESDLAIICRLAHEHLTEGATVRNDVLRSALWVRCLAMAGDSQGTFAAAWMRLSKSARDRLKDLNGFKKGIERHANEHVPCAGHSHQYRSTTTLYNKWRSNSTGSLGEGF